MTDSDVKPEKQKDDQKKSEEKFTIGLIMPISGTKDSGLYTADHWKNVKSIIEDAAQLEDIPLVSESAESTIIQTRIVKNIFDSSLVIADLSTGNANVMFEVGIRMTFGKPILLIQDDKTENYFDISPVEHLLYDSDLNYPSIHEFQNNLSEQISKVKDSGGGKQYKNYFFDTKIKEAKPESRNISESKAILEKLDTVEQKVNNLNSIRVEKDRTIHSDYIDDKKRALTLYIDMLYSYILGAYNREGIEYKGLTHQAFLKACSDCGIKLEKNEEYFVFNKVTAKLNKDYKI